MPPISKTAMYRLLLACSVLVFFFGLAACTQLPPVGAVSLSPIPAGEARIWFCRVYDPTESKGHPYIYMNGATVGISEQGQAFYRDVPAGGYHITVESYGRNLNQFQDIALAPGEQEHVKILSLRSWVQSGRNFGGDTFYAAVIPPEFGGVELSRYPFLSG